MRRPIRRSADEPSAIARCVSFLLKVTAPISFTTPSHKSLVVGFEPGQGTPLHPAGPATYYVVEGEGWITEDTTRHEIKPGSVVVVGGGVQRRIEAKTRLIILAARGG